MRYSLLAINFVLLGGAVYFVSSASSASHVLNPQVALVSTSDGNGSERATNPLDQLSSAEIAVHVSRMTQLETAVAVTNQADSVSSRSAIVSHDDTLVGKPQIMTTDVKTKADIVVYTVQEGDTVGSLANRFGVTSDSIRWSNDMTSWATLRVGQEIVIPPVNGVVYTVQTNDTPESLAQRFQASEEKIIRFNDAEIDGLVPGERIVIPNGERQTQQAPSVAYYGFAGSASYGQFNGYVYGYCTWHAANRRAQAGKPLPNNLGHARTWGPRAQQFGMSVTENPTAGSVIWHKDTSIAWGLGHVGYVERVNEDGSIVVSDMNYPWWNRVTERTVTPAEFGAYLFIH